METRGKFTAADLNSAISRVIAIHTVFTLSVQDILYIGTPFRKLVQAYIVVSLDIEALTP